MPKKSRILLALTFLPVLLGIAASLLAPGMWDPVPILVFKIDVGMVAFMAGLLITFILLAHWIGSARTEGRARRAIEEKMNESEMGRRRFLRRLDHEMKNPLTGLRAALVNLQEAQNKDERIRAADNAKRAQERLTSLLNDLRKLADLDERQIERERVDVPDLLNDVVDAARSHPTYEGRNINLHHRGALPLQVDQSIASTGSTGCQRSHLRQSLVYFQGQLSHNCEAASSGLASPCDLSRSD